MKYNNLMIDLETFGKGAEAVVLSIAAIPFEKGVDAGNNPVFSKNIDLADSLNWGRKIEAETLIWWLHQDQEILKSLMEWPEKLETVFYGLKNFINEHCVKDVKVWSKGPSFDASILSNIYSMRGFGIPKPWEYYNERCVRTELHGWEEIVKNKVPPPAYKHEPKYDCLYQIACINYVYLQTHVL
ncbi:3'-5' exoribonuclease [Belliella sp. DSM 107340]|uniref:3'-5' exoribonuclease n=1 Tax=Belliella calami TaxID=2923436 RepID=A0ABS9UV21_9BACT|nr:3'-5' exonuclease [Belliella calami]MCH7400103.1 3'-5' exoribonuclease [Belliella calami]